MNRRTFHFTQNGKGGVREVRKVIIISVMSFNSFYPNLAPRGKAGRHLLTAE